MKKTTLKNYAALLAGCGIAVKKGDFVIVQAGLDQPDFVYMCVEACYKAGAAKVMVEWDYQPLAKLNVRYQSLKTLSAVDDIARAKLQYRVDKTPSMLCLISDDPDGLKGINQEKQGKAMQARYPVIKPFRDAMDNKYKWCIAAVPGEAWAKKVKHWQPLRRDYQRAATEKTGVAYWDLTTAPCEAIAKTGKPLNWFHRDLCHNDDRGKQLIAQTFAAYFSKHTIGK